MERLYADRIEEHAPFLALHFTRGGDAEKAYRYHHLAGDRAAASYANREAMTHYQEAWRLIPPEGKDPQPPRNGSTQRSGSPRSWSRSGSSRHPCAPSRRPHPRARHKRPRPLRLGPLLDGEQLRQHGPLRRSQNPSLPGPGPRPAVRRQRSRGLRRNYLCQLDSVQGYLRRALEHADASIACLREAGNTRGSRGQ